MVNAVFDPALFDSPAATERPLGVSMLASTLFHLLVIAALTTVAPRIALLPSWQGASAPILVELQRQAALAPESPPEPVPVISVPDRLPLLAPVFPKELTIKVPVPLATPSNAAARPPLSIRTGPPNPHGSVAVGLLRNPEWVSTAVAARLAQRFPATPARAPRLNGAVITGYPIEAARAHRSARIAAVLTIDASGNIVERDTLLSPDDPTFRSAVLTALAGTRFAPAENDGKPVGYWAIMEFVFDIDPLPGARAAAER